MSLPRYFRINFLYRIQHPPPHSQVQPQQQQFCYSCLMAMSFASLVTCWWITVTRYGDMRCVKRVVIPFGCTLSRGSICHDRVIHLGAGIWLHPWILLKHQRKVLTVPPGLLVSSGQLIYYPQCFLVVRRRFAVLDRSKWERSLVSDKACGQNLRPQCMYCFFFLGALSLSCIVDDRTHNQVYCDYTTLVKGSIS